MAYCEKCGAYIPDGQSKCLACGYDEAEAQGSSAHAYQQQEDPRAQAEERRRQRQEADRKWAETEQRRRNAEAELKRRAKDAEQKVQDFVNRRTAGTDDWQESGGGRFRMSSAGDGFKPPLGQSKILAALSYVSILFLIPLLFAQEDEFARFHAKQGARLFICNAIGTVIGAIFPVGWILKLLFIYLMIVGIKNALNGREKPLPYIG